MLACFLVSEIRLLILRRNFILSLFRSTFCCLQISPGVFSVCLAQKESPLLWQVIRSGKSYSVHNLDILFWWYRVPFNVLLSLFGRVLGVLLPELNRLVLMLTFYPIFVTSSPLKSFVLTILYSSLVNCRLVNPFSYCLGVNPGFRMMVSVLGLVLLSLRQLPLVCFFPCFPEKIVCLINKIGRLRNVSSSKTMDVKQKY